MSGSWQRWRDIPWLWISTGALIWAIIAIVIRRLAT